ncbi:hypothetical protein AJ79_08022 [Helicocarpus griseus UAMH5409]|uniref:Uncharacterized protein n=1 Tax=Helicocarpus griseus UAMH5409 TaxID=1447875 RepID=A0A2B7WWT8_9EURO|nr:hypothetical protein AJ79_08022 [Helicocarpus griseus UAMH5409]
MAIPLRPLEVFTQHYASTILSAPGTVAHDSAEAEASQDLTEFPSSSPTENHESTMLPQTKYDWQTSFLWYDTRWPQNPAGEFHVDEDIIEERYPALAPFYFSWHEAYEESFEKQECHLGSGAEVFPEVEARVAWEVAGSLMACWLALQDEVERVSYEAPTGTYEICEKSMEGMLERFLLDANELL